MISGESFLEHLRTALKHLYDPYYLRGSPLLGIFGLFDQPDAIPALQQILTRAIEDLEPRAGSTASAQNQLIYDLLTYRYIQQFSQDEVANQLGMSVRHMRREQNTATYMLAVALWKTYKLGDRAFEVIDAHPTSGTAAEDAKAEPEEASQENELAFLRESGGAEAIQMEQKFANVMRLATPLAEKYSVRLTLLPLPHLPQIYTQPMALRQLLLNLLGIAIGRASAMQVNLSAGISCGMVTVEIHAPRARGAPLPENPTEKSNLEMAYRLAEICGSKLSFLTEADELRITFALPTLPQYRVLVIDDNRDNARLMERFVAGTRFGLESTQDPASALETTLQQHPDVIILDVMMPDIDGWEILGRLRSHPNTSAIPVVVCTILAQEELALSLGASGFLHKPITRQALLEELDRQAALLEKESR